jgi:hypothetical protein
VHEKGRPFQNGASRTPQEKAFEDMHPAFWCLGCQQLLAQAALPERIASNKLSFLTIILHLSAGFHITTGYTINK